VLQLFELDVEKGLMVVVELEEKYFLQLMVIFLQIQK
jgi:hypothetical protein